MVNRSLLLMIGLLLAGSQLQAQECVDQLLRTVELLSKQCDPAHHSSYRASYSLELERWEGGKENHRFEVLSDGKRHYLFSNQYNVLADDQLTVSIQKPSEVISIGSSLNSEMRSQSIARVMQQQVANINMLELQACETMEVGGKQRTHLVLRCPDRYRQAYNIDRVEYEFDQAYLYQVSVYSLEGGPAKVTTYRIHEIETDRDFARLGKAPTDHILDANGNLLPEFANYTIEQIGNASATTNIPSPQQQNQ